MTLTKTCATAGCTTPVAPGHRHCGYHADQERAHRNQRVKAYGYSSANWRTIRAQRLSLER